LAELLQYAEKQIDDIAKQVEKSPQEIILGSFQAVNVLYGRFLIIPTQKNLVRSN
jgi:hypothetical protein